MEIEFDLVGKTVTKVRPNEEGNSSCSVEHLMVNQFMFNSLFFP